MADYTHFRIENAQSVAPSSFRSAPLPSGVGGVLKEKRCKRKSTLCPIDEDIEDVYNEIADLRMDVVLKITKIYTNMKFMQENSEKQSMQINNLQKKLKDLEKVEDIVSMKVVSIFAFHYILLGIILLWYYETNIKNV